MFPPSPHRVGRKAAPGTDAVVTSFGASLDLPGGSVFFLSDGNSHRFCNKPLCSISGLHHISICFSDNRLLETSFGFVTGADFSLVLPKDTSPAMASGKNKSALISLILSFNSLPLGIVFYVKIFIIHNM